MMNIKLKEHTTDIVIREVYQLTVDSIPYTVKELCNAKYKVLDTEIADACGNPLPADGDGPLIYDAIMVFLNDLDDEEEGK
jgi:hypothetical protein